MASIFLSYAKEDQPKVQEVYRALRAAGLSPWMDKPPAPYQLEGIRPGEDWDSAIRGAIKEAQLVLAFFSKTSVEKQGYVQREYRLALSSTMNKPAGTISFVPVLLEECAPPDVRVDTISLNQFQWYALYEDGLDNLVQSLLITMSSRTPAASTSKDFDAVTTANTAALLAYDYRYKVDAMAQKIDALEDRLRSADAQMMVEAVGRDLHSSRDYKLDRFGR